MGLRYDPVADRLEGGNFVRDFQGRPVLQVLLSKRRAKLIFEAAGELKRAYDELPEAAGSSEDPFSQPLAVLELNSYPVVSKGQNLAISIDELFAHPDLAMAPPEYRELTQMILVPPGVKTLQQLIDQREHFDPIRFVRQLFRTIGCAHVRAKMTFTRQNGSNINPREVTPVGEIVGIYYLTRASEAKRRFEENRKSDIMNGLQLAVQAAGKNISPTIVDEAVRCYSVSLTSHISLSTNYPAMRQKLNAIPNDEGGVRDALEALTELLTSATRQS